MLRRYAAGYSALSDFLMQEMGADDPTGTPAELYRLQRELTALFDRLLEAVGAEYEDSSRHVVPSERRARRVRRLIAGELIATSELEYDFGCYHLGAIASGPEAGEALRGLAKALDCRLLTVPRGEETLWAWLKHDRTLDTEEFERLLVKVWPDQVSLAIDEPAQGLAGWRLTQRRAGAALSVALHRLQRLTRYADVALLASVLRDRDLATFSLRPSFYPFAANARPLRLCLRRFAPTSPPAAMSPSLLLRLASRDTRSPIVSAPSNRGSPVLSTPAQPR